MRKLWKLSIICFSLVMLSACGEEGGAEDDGIRIVESEPLNEVSSEDVRTLETEGTDIEGTKEPEDDEPEKLTAEEEAETDSFEGKYNDYDAEEPSLEIRKNEDGSYRIYIGIFRLASFDDAVGMLTENGLAFTATAPDGKEQTGVISLDGDIATVTFDPGWDGFEDVYSYKYYKISDMPEFND